MKEKFSGTWKDAFLASPGPTTLRQSVGLWLKGICMGSADVIPGVSGGTIALITGIYEELIGALRSFDWAVIQKILTFDLKGAIARVPGRFLIILFFGIITAILSLARLMNYLLHYHPVPTWSLFFGLIVASILIVGRQVTGWFGKGGLCFVAGIIAGSIIVNLIPIDTPDDLWFIFLCGFVAICAMILPGISGAFILLVLGKYEFITGTLKNPFLMQNIIVISVFCLGCLIGLGSFSRGLNYLLSKFHNLTLAFLAGLITGSLQKIWPWKKVIDIRMIAGNEHVIWGHPILPANIDGELFLAVLMALAGFGAVWLIERMSSSR